MPSDQGQPPRHALGVDFGTSYTVAVARWPDGRARPILIDGSPLLPSAVYAERDGQLIVGRDAVHSARLDPARFEPNPKRRIDAGTVLLGEHKVPVVDLFAAVLARVAEQWHRAVGPVSPIVTLTCPAGWGSTRRAMLAEAAATAGFAAARLVAEPVAAATYFAELLGRDVPIGSVVVVHDFGAGTFEASVVARTVAGFEVLAVDSRDDLGGLDVDAAIVEHLGRTIAVRDPAAWQRLTSPTTVEERRAHRQLWDDVRVTKERLSRAQSADLVIPLADIEVHLTRAELETLAEPVIVQTIEVTTALLRWAELAEGRIAGVILVGGSSRIPLVATMVHRALDEAPVVIEQPELAVAEGCVLATVAVLTTDPAAPGPTPELRPPGAPASTAVDAAPPMPTAVDAASSAPTAADAALSAPAAEDAALSAPAGVDAALSVPTGVDAALSASPAADAALSVPPEVDTARSAPTEQVSGGPARAIDEPWAAHRWDEAAALKLHEELWPDGQPDDWPADDRGSDSTTIPAVDPWPHAPAELWVDDPQRTVAQDVWKPADLARYVEPAADSVDAPVESPTAAPTAGPTAAPTAPPTGGPTAAKASARAAVSVRPQPLKQPKASRQSTQQPSKQAKPPKVSLQPRQQPARTPSTRARRRPGRFLRFVKLLLSVALLVSAPIVVAIAAYGYGNGLPIGQDAVDLARDILRIIRSW